MKNIVLASMLLAFLPLMAVAQGNNDLYFIPKKEKKVEVKEKKVGVVPKEVSNRTVNTMPGTPSVVVRDTKGNVRDVDEYNRRYTSRDNTFSSDGETLYIDEKPYNERGEWVNGFKGSDMDYEYAMRLVRFRSPRYAIPVSSPLYWDVVYGAIPSWDWNVFDDGMYAYVFPTYSNRYWWDWRFSSGFYRPGFSFSIGWHSPWYYNRWHSPYWYGGWYGGYWGHHWYDHHYWHHPYYSHYGWGGGWYRSGHSDYRPGRYQSHNRSFIVSSGSSNSYTRRPQQSSSSAISGNRARVANNRSSIGRVVDGSNSRNSSSSSVRPGRTAVRNQGVSTGTNSGSRVNSSTYTRPSTGTYTRRSVTNIDRTGSDYNRPSSTRRSTNYDSRRSSNSTYQRSNSSSSRSSFSRGGSSYSRSSGGSATRSSGGSRRR